MPLSIKKGLAVALLGLLNCPALAQSPTSLDAVLQRSSELLAQREMQAAVDLLESQRTAYPDSIELLNNLAIAYLGTGRFAESEHLLQELVEQDPVYRIITHNLLELESSEGGTQPIDPLLFVQSATTWYQREVVDAQQLAGDRVALRPADPGPEAEPAVPAVELPAALTTANQPNQTEVRRLVEAWRNAWVAKDLDAYLAYYSDDFTPRQGALAAWRADRAEKLGISGEIRIDLSNFDISIYNNEIRARFDQRYESPSYNDFVRKLLVIDNPDGQWRIVREAALEVYEIY